MRNPEISLDNVLDRYAGSRVLVLGGSGFVGRWVARLLSKAGAELYLPARDCAAANSMFRDYRIDGNLFKLDLNDFDLLRRFMSEVEPAVVFNLAGYGIDRSESEDELAHRINSQLPEVVCSALAGSKHTDAWRGQRFIHVGTAMEYGSAAGDLRESSETLPTTLYGKTKLAGTSAVNSACAANNFPGITARLFAIYGPGEGQQRLLPTLMAESGKTGPIELTDGLHKRDFTYVEDVAEALLRLGVSQCTPGEVINVATGELTSIRSFVEIAAASLGIASDRLRFGALETRPEEMHHDGVNTSRLRRITGWGLGIDIPEGVRRSIAFGRKKVHTNTVASGVRPVATYAG